VVVHVENKILSHDCEADQADITRCIWHKLSNISVKWLLRMIAGVSAELQQGAAPQPIKKTAEQSQCPSRGFRKKPN
jgi:hypothetical protein